MSARSKKVFPKSTAKDFHHDGDIRITTATLDHAEYLQNHLRLTDVRECMIHGATPWRALHYPLKRKDAITWTGLYKNVPVCMFGVVPINSEDGFKTGSIWLLGTHMIDQYPRKFLPLTRQMLDYIAEDWDVLENVVPIDHQKTLNWLNWLDFMFGEDIVKINGFACVRFVRCAPSIEVTFE
jgi:hypothetical protein